SSLERAFAPLERARQIAVALGDHDRLANAILQIAKLYVQAERLDEAEAFCASLDMVPCGPEYRAQQDEIMAIILLRRGCFDEAAGVFEGILPVYDGPDRAERRCAALGSLGEAHAGAGRVEAAIRAYEAALETFEERRLALFEESRLRVAANVAE